MELILNAECALFTMISILIGLWYGKINNAIDIYYKIKDIDSAMCQEDRFKIIRVVWPEYVILLSVMIMTILLYVIPFIGIAKDVFNKKYDVLSLTIAALYIICFILTFYFICWFVKLCHLVYTKRYKREK